jgi:hypothetical protein
VFELVICILLQEIYTYIYIEMATALRRTSVPVMGVHRLAGNPVRDRDYIVEESGSVRFYERPANGLFDKKSVPVGISVFIPSCPEEHHGFLKVEVGGNILNGTLPSPFRMVFIQQMGLKLLNDVRVYVKHFHVYVDEDGVTENQLLNVLRSPVDDGYHWSPCHQGGGSSLCTDLFRSDEADDFEDCDVRTLLYYVSEWYKQCDTDDMTARVLMNSFYMWLSEEKPTLEDIAQDAAHSSFALYLLRNYSAADGDCMGGAELEHIQAILEGEVANANA